MAAFWGSCARILPLLLSTRQRQSEAWLGEPHLIRLTRRSRSYQDLHTESDSFSRVFNRLRCVFVQFESAGGRTVRRRLCAYLLQARSKSFNLLLLFGNNRLFALHLWTVAAQWSLPAVRSSIVAPHFCSAP